MGDAGAQAQAQWEKAIGHHRAGRLIEAESAYRHLIELDARNGACHANLGAVLAMQGRRREAVSYLHTALQHGSYPEVYNTLGNVLKDEGELPEAIGAFRSAITLRAGYPDAHFNLGTALQLAGRTTEAIDSYGRAISLRPGHAGAHNNLGQSLWQTGRVEEGLAAFSRAVEIHGDFAEARNNLGSALTSIGRHEQALIHLRVAAGLRSDSPDVLNNLGNALRCSGRLDEAIEALRRAVELRPGFAEAMANLAAALRDTGQIDESIGYYRKAMELKPDARTGAGLLFALHHHPATTAEQLKVEHVAWDRQFCAEFESQWKGHANDRSPDRRLRVGYVGAVGDSPVGRFLLPLLAHQDRARFDVFVYADVPRGDRFAGRLRPHANVWHEIFLWSDEQLVGQVREDGIDILVDLAMHGGRNRLLAFARKPAPVQVTYLAYAGTTGLAAMDYRLSDPHLDPPGRGDGDYCEKTVRLPETFWCYEPGVDVEAASTLPSLSSGRMTFGCLNSSAKVNAEVLKVWKRVLDAIPDARMILHSHEGDHRRRALEALGGDSSRVEFVGLLPAEKYFEVYRRIDIALDPFPFPGGTTTCDALWMGAPVVTLEGNTAVSRGGKSILTNMGLEELIANNVDRYVAIAVELARDQNRLVNLKGTLRERMKRSALMDGGGFARGVEQAFDGMWRGWCEGDRGAQGNVGIEC